MGAWQFEDITDRAEVPGPNYAMGAAVGDYDDDGRLDLFVTGWRDQRLYHNLGGGRFEDVTRKAGLISNLWSTSAAFADLDGDGDPDLFVASYVEFDPQSSPFCATPDGRRDYCGPEDFPAQSDRLYRNNGDGTFTDVSKSAGLDLPEGRGLGVLVAELTGDHRPDLYVANDSSPCWLFANQGDLHFEEIGEEAGVARDGHGEVLSGMGVALGDLDGDGLSDLAVANFHERSTIAFRAQGRPRRGLSRCVELARAGRRHPAASLDSAWRWWTSMATDTSTCLQTNGHVLDRARLGTPFAMRPTLLRNTGDRRSRMSQPPPVPGSTGPAWDAAWRSATWTATADPMSWPPLWTPPPRCFRISRRVDDTSSSSWSTVTVGRPSGAGARHGRRADPGRSARSGG